MSNPWTKQEQVLVPFLEKTRYIYIGTAFISLLVVFFFNAGITRLLVGKSLTRAVILFFILPLLALLTRPHGKERAVGVIYALRQKDQQFWISTLTWWGIGVACAVAIILFLFSLGYDRMAAGVSNWVYSFSFLTLLVNLIPEPPPPAKSIRYHLPIGLWGPGGSGKTVFLGMLFSDLKKGTRHFFEKEASDYVISVRNALAEEKWPEETRPPVPGPKKTRPLKFYFARPGGWYPYLGLKYISVEFEDTAGKLFENPSADAFIKDSHLIFYKLARSAGALFVVDHCFSEKPEKLQFILEENLDRILKECEPKGARKKIPFPTAVVISKVDSIYPEYEKFKDKPGDFFSHLFGEEILTLLKEKIAKSRIFCFSCVGVKEDDGKRVPRLHRKNGDGDNVPDENLEPFGLFEPVEWLLIRSKRYVLKEKIKKLLKRPFKFIQGK